MICIVWFGCCLRLVWWLRCGLGIGFGFNDCVGWFELVWFYDVECAYGCGVVVTCFLICFVLDGFI